MLLYSVQGSLQQRGYKLTEIYKLNLLQRRKLQSAYQVEIFFLN